mgnify:CR=1 FL=1
MNAESSELAEFLDVVAEVLTRFVEPGRRVNPDRRAELVSALADAGVLDLATETADMTDAVAWLVGTVRTVAQHSPSVGYALATRYVGQRATGDESAIAVTAALVSPEAPRPIIPTMFPVDKAALVGVAEPTLSIAEVSPATLTSVAVTGLADAELRHLEPGEPSTVADSIRCRDALRDFAILVSAVSLGIADAASTASESYATQRRQFGAPIASFTGLRAILATMRHRVATVEALLDTALNRGELAAALELARTAGGSALDVTLTGVQVHGGYGYIDEYPIASLVRDAVSVSSRNIPHRVAASMLAADRLGVVAAP